MYYADIKEWNLSCFHEDVYVILLRMICNNEKKFQNIHNELKQKGFRWTKPRKQILEVFLDNQLPMTAGEVLSKVGEAEMNFSSIYRTIELFCKEGVLTLFDAVSEGKRFALSDKYREHRHYLICQSCDKTVSFETCFIHELEEKVGKKFNFTIASHDLRLSGYCENCS